MRVEPLVPDAMSPAPTIGEGDSAAFARALDAAGGTLERAQRAEDDFARGGGTLHEAIYERARADVALAVATAVAGKAAQAVNAVMAMQV